MFAEITEEISGDTYISSSLIIIRTTNIFIQQLENKGVELETEGAKKFAKTLLSFVNTYLVLYETKLCSE